jgi:hypothetical protein
MPELSLDALFIERDGQQSAKQLLMKINALCPRSMFADDEGISQRSRPGAMHRVAPIELARPCLQVEALGTRKAQADRLPHRINLAL